MSITRPNIVQQENRLRSLPDEALRAMLLQMGQTGQVGSPEYLLAAGEMQARKNVRQQAQMGQPQQPPVIAELLTGIPMQGGTPQPQAQPQQPMPEEAGVAALPAQNLEALDQPQYADGGIVAFQAGASVRNPFLVDEMAALDQMSPEERKEYYRKKFQSREAALKGGRPAGAPPSAAPRRLPGVMGLAGKAAGVFGPALTLGWDQLYGTSDEDMEKLRAFDAAKERLKAAGFTDKDIDAMPRETIYRMASGYQPKTVPGPGAAGGEFIPVDPNVVAAPDGVASGAGGVGQGGAGGITTGRGMYGQVEDFMKRFYPTSTEQAPTTAEAVAQERAALEAAGVDLDPNKELREKVQRGMAEAERNKERAGWEALAQFGLTLASTPGDFLTAIGKAGLPALQAYTGEIKELRKLAREDDRLISQLKSADNDLKLKVTQSGLARRDKILDRIDAERGRAGTIAASVFGGLASLEASRESKAATITQTQRATALEQANDVVDKMIRSDFSLAQDPARQAEIRNSLYNQFLQRLSGATPTGVSAGPRGRVVNGVYVPAGQ